jgi:hypothetical protein
MFELLTRRCVYLAVCAALCASHGSAHGGPSSQATPGNCEVNAAKLDSVRQEALTKDRDGFVIVIARLGNQESSRRHNRTRLSAVEGYLSKHGLGKERILLAEGEEVSGYGKVELYVGGRLVETLYANRNRGLCVECCDPRPEDFYKRRGKKND